MMLTTAPNIRWQGTTIVDSIRLTRRGWGFRAWVIDCTTKRSEADGVIRSSGPGIGDNEYYYQLAAPINGLYVMYGPWPHAWDYEGELGPSTCIRLPLPTWGPGWTVVGERCGKYEHAVLASRESWREWLRWTVWWRLRTRMKYRRRKK